jgi:hypothetical protein
MMKTMLTTTNNHTLLRGMVAVCGDVIEGVGERGALAKSNVARALRIGRRPFDYHYCNSSYF